MKYTVLAAIVAASVARAQVDPNTINPCLKGCAETAAVTAGCSSIYDTNCVCTSKKDAFISAATPCVISGCPDQVSGALALVQKLCTEGIKQDTPAPEPSSEAPPPASSEAPPPEQSEAPPSESPAPTSAEEPAPTSETPGPASSEAPPAASGGATDGGAGAGDLNGISACGQKCLADALASQGCKGADDNACICTDAYKSAVTPCIAACEPADITKALELSAKRCAAGGGDAKPSVSGDVAPPAASSGSKPPAGGDAEPECDPRGGSGACAKKFTQPATLTKAEPTPAASSAAAAGAEADAANQGSGASGLKASILLAVAGTFAAALF